MPAEATDVRDDAATLRLRDHLVCRIVPEPVPVARKHDVEGLVMGTE